MEPLSYIELVIEDPDVIDIEIHSEEMGEDETLDMQPNNPRASSKRKVSHEGGTDHNQSLKKLKLGEEETDSAGMDSES